MKPIHLQYNPAEAVIYVHSTVFQIAINTPWSTFCACRLSDLQLNFYSSLTITFSISRDISDLNIPDAVHANVRLSTL